MKHYNLWHSLIFQWSHWFPRVRPWQGRPQNSQNVIPMLPRWGIFFFFYSTNWALGWLHMLWNGFSPESTETALRNSASWPCPANYFQGFCAESSKQGAQFVYFLKEETDWCRARSKLLKLSHFRQRADALSSFLVERCSSLSHTYLHHDVSVVHTTTTHAFVPFTDSIAAPHTDRL